MIAPKRISLSLLLLIWLTGTLPYFLIEFWLCNLPALFHGAGKVGGFVADFSLAFSTAFPFWFVTEWFSRRTRQSEIALIQRNFLDRTLEDFNRFFHFMSSGGSETFQSIIPNYALTAKDKSLGAKVPHFVEERSAQMLLRLGDLTENDRQEVKNIPTFNIEWNIGQLEKRLLLIEPYQRDFSLDFNEDLQRIAIECGHARRIVMEYPRGDENRSPFMVGSYLLIRGFLLRLENHYRREHRAGSLVLHPDSEHH